MKTLAAAPLAVLLLAAAAPADEILLKNGRSLEGRVTESGETVILEKAGLPGLEWGLWGWPIMVLLWGGGLIGLQRRYR